VVNLRIGFNSFLGFGRGLPELYLWLEGNWPGSSLIRGWIFNPDYLIGLRVGIGIVLLPLSSERGLGLPSFLHFLEDLEFTHIFNGDYPLLPFFRKRLAPLEEY